MSVVLNQVLKVLLNVTICPFRGPKYCHKWHHRVYAQYSFLQNFNLILSKKTITDWQLTPMTISVLIECVTCVIRASTSPTAMMSYCTVDRPRAAAVWAQEEWEIIIRLFNHFEISRNFDKKHILTGRSNIESVQLEFVSYRNFNLCIHLAKRPCRSLYLVVFSSSYQESHRLHQWVWTQPLISPTELAGFAKAQKYVCFR